MTPVLSRAEWMALQQRAARSAGAPSGESLLEYARRASMPSEHAEQTWLMERLAATEVRIPELALVFAVPNGGHRHKAVAAKMKAEGVRRAVPDLVWPVARGRYHGLFVEMKKLDGHASPEQKALHERYRAQGYFVVTCQGNEAGYQAFLRYWDFGPFTWGPS